MNLLSLSRKQNILPTNWQRIFVDIVVKQYDLKIFLNVPSGELNDPKTITRDLTKLRKIGHWGDDDYKVKLEKEEEID